MMTNPVILDAVSLALVWVMYFCIHSLLASLSVKTIVRQRFLIFMPYYRLTFNITAIFLLIPPLWFLYTGEKVHLWSFTGVSFWITQAFALAAVIGFLISACYYDGKEFLGLRQLSENETRIEDQENLLLSPFHCYVRHPWYAPWIALC